ncbi:uncharacterized protein K02A2.6-like [Centruroides sculpturatus]|uniref:uncharacterized protein K02A2.6-like n=1 Tax=Centruroides sculpturatus TaxID=218467 RepID=UPI000C6EC517|nr:uncharacterized protein K02A2.6-like [Centruroides sculpturatus]
MLARSIVWWPGIDSDLERTVKECILCQSYHRNPPSTNTLRWPIPEEPWSRVHIDFAGPFLGKMFLIGIDAKTKYPEIQIMQSTDSSATILALRSWFSRHGLPLHVHSDNGPQFTSREFRMFLAQNGIRQTFSSPYHPATNGAVEGFIKTLSRPYKN